MEHIKRPFNVNDYCGKKIAIHCPTVEIAFELISLLREGGYDKTNLLDIDIERLFSDDSRNPCIAFVKEHIYYGTWSQCLSAGYKVYESSDFTFSDIPEVSPELTSFLLSVM